ncbi:MAG: hypothetical protein OEW24_06565 [Chloroflexota bacterium]|nr:hypothetical protein [Chloroflexota bacterium]
MSARFSTAAVVVLLALPLLTGAGGDDRMDEIGKVAVAYAQGFDALLQADPSEGDRLGVTAEDLQSLQPVTILPLRALDAQFRQEDDARTIDMATVSTDLWWVVLGIDSAPKIVVTVQWPSTVDQPEAVALNQVPAQLLSDALNEVGDPNARIVYIPEDATVVLGSARGVSVAMPVADEVFRAALELPDRPVAVGEYTSALKTRLSRLAAAWAMGDRDPGLAGGGPTPVVPARGIGFPLPAVLGAAAVAAFMGAVAVSRRRPT